MTKESPTPTESRFEQYGLDQLVACRRPRTVFISAFCLATVGLATSMALDVQYTPKETIYTVTGFFAMLLVGLLNAVAWMARKSESASCGESHHRNRT